MNDVSQQVQADVASAIGTLQIKVIELSRALEASTASVTAKDERIAELEAMLDAEGGTE